MKIPDDKVVYAASSTQCNNNCVFCTDFSEEGWRDNSAAVKKLKASSRGRRIVFTAAEPTLNPGLFALIEEASGLGYGSIAVITNGRMLAYRDYCSRLLASGVSEIIVSLHGATARVHDAITGVDGSWAQTVRGLSNALTLRPAGSKVKISANATVNALNISSLAALRDFFLGLKGLKNVVFHGLRPAGRALTDWDRLSVPYSRFVSALAPAAGPWPANLRVWDVPLCAARPAVPEAACEFARSSTGIIGERGFSADLLAGKTALPCCRRCPKLPVCGGVYSRYLKTYGAAEFYACE